MSDDPHQRSDTDWTRYLLEQSGKALEEALEAVGIMAERMRSGEEIPQAELQKMLAAHSHSRAKLISGVKEHDDAVLFSEGRVATAPLDLDAIRAEIGSRIDRIRAAIDEEGIS